jgi:3-phosphoshikimate 1-carboxyvinyltransferase
MKRQPLFPQPNHSLMSTAGYPSELTLEPWNTAPRGVTAHVPGSKSLTNRALVVAAMGDGSSTLRGALDCEDTQVMVAALRALGIEVAHDTGSAIITVRGCSGTIPSCEATLFVANSGTSLRFLTAMVATGVGKFRLDGTPRMRQRPISDLLVALNGLRARATSDLGTGCPPVTIEASGLSGGDVFVRSDVSSQFLSALLMALPSARDATTIEVQGTLVSQPYIAMTLAVMESFGVAVNNRKFRRFDVRPAHYQGREYLVEPDASAASYFFALAALTGGSVTVEGLGTSSIQGDMAFVDVLEHMGCAVEREPTRTTVTGGPLRAVDVDMNAFSDTVMTQAVVALFAEGVSRIRNVAHIRHKETDRLSALAIELRKLGARVDEQPDGLVIDPPALHQLHGASIATYNDHRMAMSFALAGLRIPGVTILDPGCVAKTYPGFWTDLEQLRASNA